MAFKSRWIELITEMLWVFERETKFTLRGINDDFKLTGLSFDLEFREHFFDVIQQRITKTYDEFQMQLEKEDLQSKCIDSEASFMGWEPSTGHNGVNSFQKPFPAQKRRIIDGIDSPDHTYLVKRPRVNETIAAEPNVESHLDLAIENDVMDPEEMRENDANILNSVDAVDNGGVKSIPAKLTSSTRASSGNVDEKSQKLQKIEKHSKLSLPNKISQKTDQSVDIPLKDAHIKLVDVVTKGAKAITSTPETAQTTRIKRKLNRKSAEAKSNKWTSKKTLNESSNSDETFSVDVRQIPSNDRTSSLASRVSTIMRSANGKKRFYCNKCGYGTMRRDHFIRHLKRHLAYLCNMCPRKFEDMAEYVQHQSEHKNQCLLCKKKFKTNLACEQHKAKDHVRFFECYACKFCCTKVSTLRNHMDRKHLSDPYNLTKNMC